MSDKDTIEDDFDFARAQYYKLAGDGQEAIDLMMELARDTEHPRAFEVLSNMMKQNAEITDRLMDLQKKKKDVKQVKQDKGEPAQLTQNNVFVGSATDLQKMLHGKIENVIDAESQE